MSELTPEQKATVGRDILLALFDDTKRRLIASGLSEKEADERASFEVRQSIRRS